MDWAGMWFHQDGLVHVIGTYSAGANRRSMFSECHVMLACIPSYAQHSFLGSNTRHVFPTCVACWHESNFGSYAPRR